MITKTGTYHVSLRDTDELTLQPRVPRNYMTDKGFEDNTTPRVSLSSSIKGALTGLSSNIKGKELTVYRLQNNPKLLSNRKLSKKVPDAHISKEVWALEPAKLQKIKKIKVIDTEEKPITYSYGGDKRADTYKWKYRSSKS